MPSLIHLAYQPSYQYGRHVLLLAPPATQHHYDDGKPLRGQPSTPPPPRVPFLPPCFSLSLIRHCCPVCAALSSASFLKHRATAHLHLGRRLLPTTSDARVVFFPIVRQFGSWWQLIKLQSDGHHQPLFTLIASASVRVSDPHCTHNQFLA